MSEAPRTFSTPGQGDSIAANDWICALLARLKMARERAPSP
jgi:hypothetical protein